MQFTKKTIHEGRLSESDQARIRDHLSKLLESPAFVHSQRSQSFLRYIVEETLAGNTDQIKERNIGVDVFGKDESFDPQEESIVRVGAGEVRRRLLQAYQKSFEDGIQIELPVGSYCPKFTIKNATPPPLPLDSHPSEQGTEDKSPALQNLSPISPSRRWIKRGVLYSIGILLCAGLTAVVVSIMLRPRQPLDPLWQMFIEPAHPVLIALPAPPALAPLQPSSSNSPDSRALPSQTPPVRQGALSSGYTGIGAGWGAARFAEQLAFRHQSFILRFGGDISFTDVEQHPTILLGGLSSKIGVEITSQLRYKLIEGDGKISIVDTSGKDQGWNVPLNQPASGGYESYTLISILRNGSFTYPVMVVAGMRIADTRAGAEFLTENQYFQVFSRAAPKGWQDKNCQIILRNIAYGDSPGKPELAGWYVW